MLENKRRLQVFNIKHIRYYDIGNYVKKYKIYKFLLTFDSLSSFRVYCRFHFLFFLFPAVFISNFLFYNFSFNFTIFQSITHNCLTSYKVSLVEEFFLCQWSQTEQSLLCNGLLSRQPITTDITFYYSCWNGREKKLR